MDSMNLAILLVSTVFLTAYNVSACNEAVCASVVSKCQLTQSCKCDLKNCSCCQECFTCLGYLFDECCSCVDMCPKPKDSDDLLSSKSHVEDFQDPIPDLFMSVMAEPDTLGRWTTYTFPVDIDTNPMYLPKYDQQLKLRTNNEQEVAPRKEIISVNCTVAYMSQCTSWNKCKQSCQATGASKYRWFHDGCCQCIGHTCVGYGSEKSLCSECPLSKADGFPDEDKAAFYYDDEMEFTLEDKPLQQAATAAEAVSRV